MEEMRNREDNSWLAVHAPNVSQALQSCFANSVVRECQYTGHEEENALPVLRIWNGFTEEVMFEHSSGMLVLWR